jgi:thiamine-monophosphate kinase
MKLRRLGEDGLLARLLPSLPSSKGVIAGAGDDCAIVEAPSAKNFLVLKTDCVVEKIHFTTATDPVALGWKAMMRPLSDFAAVSAVPQFALITLIVPPQKTSEWIAKVYRGLNRAAARFEVAIVGGETSGTTGPAAISVSVSGIVEKKRWLSRGGGKAGDDLFVTGRLGGSIRGKHLRFVPRIVESHWLTKNFPIHAMMDLSDGLGADLPRLAAASKLGFEIERESLPLARGVNVENAIADGEDYELLFAIAPRERKRLQNAWRKKFPKVPLTRIGAFRIPHSAFRLPKLPSGYVHFQ